MITEAKRIANHDRVVELLNSVSRDGIDELLKWLEESDFFNKGCGFICAEDLGDVVRCERNYDVRVCDKCVKKIKAYCRRHKGVMH